VHASGSARTRSALAAGLGLAVLLAAEAGYADRSHVNRECLRLTGVSSRRLKTGCFRAAWRADLSAHSFRPSLC
jgi:hypothetical protein